MKSLIILLLAFAFLPTGKAAAAKKTPAGPDVLVAADARRDLPAEFRPAPGQPIYYVLKNFQHSMGEPVAGIKLPNPAVVEHLVIEALAKQGFIRTQVGGPMASIALLINWGDANFADMSTPDPAIDPELQAAMDKVRISMSDRVGIENVVGTDKALSLAPGEKDKVLAASNEDRIYVSIAALDLMALMQRKEKRLLWRTSMSVDGRNDLSLALPAMLASGAPFFGTDAVPVFSKEVDRRKAEVNIGEMKVLSDPAKPETTPTPKK